MATVDEREAALLQAERRRVRSEANKTTRGVPRGFRRLTSDVPEELYEAYVTRARRAHLATYHLAWAALELAALGAEDLNWAKIEARAEELKEAKTNGTYEHRDLSFFL